MHNTKYVKGARSKAEIVRQKNKRWSEINKVAIQF